MEGWQDGSVGVKVLAVNPGDLSSMPGTYLVESENPFQQVVL